MTPVYQTIIDANKGNCMQAAIASLFNLSLDEVPNFIDYRDGYFHPLYDTIIKMGYEYRGCLFNLALNKKLYPEETFSDKHTLDKLSNYDGVDGYFYATVYSPKYFTTEKDLNNQITHAVIIDKNCNIVHDPNPNNINIKYPLSESVGYNGIHHIFLIEKTKTIEYLY